MKTTTRLLIMLFSALLLGACGSKPVAIADMPVYPGATELKPGESNIADTLKTNGQQDAAMRQAAGVGGIAAPIHPAGVRAVGIAVDRVNRRGGLRKRREHSRDEQC